MGSVGIMGLDANAAVAIMLYRFRSGDANMRSVWICARNDAIGNIAVVAAAVGVFGTGTAWPDLIVATVMAALGISGGWQIMRLAVTELKVSRREQPQWMCWTLLPRVTSRNYCPARPAPDPRPVTRPVRNACVRTS